jgi:hypothetical protein
LNEGNTAITPCSAYPWGETEDYTITIVQQQPCIAPPVAGLLSASDSSLCNGTFTLSLLGSSAGSGMTYDWQYSTDSITWSLLSNTASAFISTSLTQSTYYRCILTCSGMSDTSSVVHVIQNPLTSCYCTSAANNATDSDIGNVTFGSLNNGNAVPVISNSTANHTYSDFTSLPPQTFNQNTSYPISISQITSGANFFGARVTVFIDYNQNGFFTDAGERVFTGSTSNGAGGTVSVVSGTVLIPATANLGHTRMRIILSEGGGAGLQNPCGVINFGETEDYTINIDLFNGVNSISTLSNLLIFPNPTDGKTSIHYSLEKSALVSIELYNLIGEQISTLYKENHAAGNFEMDLDFKKLGVKQGIYFLKIYTGNEVKTARVTIF